MTDGQKTPAPYTEMELLRLENINLGRSVVQTALNEWQAKVRALKADLEKTRPGWDFNPDTGAWTPKADEA